MISGLQPSRPKPPQPSSQSTYPHQQRRAVHEAAQSPRPMMSQSTASSENSHRPRNQIEALPPSYPTRPPALFDSAVRHPVFFTQNLRKPPFAIPQIASHGWSPVASGYIMEQQKAMNTGLKTKL